MLTTDVDLFLNHASHSYSRCRFQVIWWVQGWVVRHKTGILHRALKKSHHSLKKEILNILYNRMLLLLLPVENNSLLQKTLNGGRSLSDPKWKQNFLRMCQASRKLCGLMEGFLTPDEVAARSLISCIVCVTLWFGSCADFCSVSL